MTADSEKMDMASRRFAMWNRWNLLVLGRAEETAETNFAPGHDEEHNRAWRVFRDWTNLTDDEWLALDVGDQVGWVERYLDQVQS